METSNTVRLYGGPMDGEVITLPIDQDHFHVVEPAEILRLITDIDSARPVDTRECMYSRVRKTKDFEWDGWRGHDF